MAPTATTHGPQAADGPPAILEPERPRRRRSNRNPATDPPAADAAGVRSPTPRGARRAARPAAGPATPPGKRPVVIRRPTGLPAPPRQPPGVLRDRSRSDSGATGTRPGGGACGPFRAALIDVQKVLPHRPAAGRIASGRGHCGSTCRCSVLPWSSSSTPARPSCRIAELDCGVAERPSCR